MPNNKELLILDLLIFDDMKLKVLCAILIIWYEQQLLKSATHIHLITICTILSS
jgi:hypothetical protein